MDEKNTGGPAFPVLQHGDSFEHLVMAHAGMSLRDYFAAKMLAQWDCGMAICDHPTMYERFAEHCYRMADAMLRARGVA